MNMLAGAAAGIVLAAMSVTTAAAQDRTRVAHDAIVRGDLAKAERTLLADRRVYGNTPQVLLNLAAIYARSGRTADASALYRDVLGQDDALMDVRAGRTVSAHAIARAGLQRLQPSVAAR